MLRKRTQKQEPQEPLKGSAELDNGSPSAPRGRKVRERAMLFPAKMDARYLQAWMANTSDVVVVLDQDFRVLDLSPAANLALGMSSEEVVEQSCMHSLSCQDLNHTALCHTSACPLVKALQKRIPLPNEELIIGAEAGHKCEVSASVTPIRIDGHNCAIFTARDMSALKVANRVRANFVSMVSHELRTPLNSVHGFIDLLLQGHMGQLTDEQRMYLGYTQEGVQQLVSIVEDILFMTRSDLGQFDIKPVETPLRVLVNQVIISLQPQAHKAEVVLNHEVPPDIPSLFVDPQRLKQVLNNLVINAIKFTPPGGTVTITARTHDEDFVMVSVMDTGYGIPAEDRPHIFERFYQSNHSQQSKLGGYGLGLSITKLIVEQHGGTIGFDTTLNKGTTFYFLLPIYKKP
jgi:two-component system phosphate regulon sensor histidine kinase PhoR